MEKYAVTFLPDNKRVEVEKGKTILAAAISAGVYINSSCGGDGVCGRCKVKLIKGKVLTQPTGRISLEEKRANIYLACLSTIQSDLEIEVPSESRLKELEKIPEEEARLRLKGFYVKAEEVDKGSSILGKEPFIHSPLATKLYLSLEPPNLKDRLSDLERLYRAIRKKYEIPIMQTGLANVRHLGALLRSSDWKVTITLGKRNGTTEIVLIEPGDTSRRNFGFAFDIGTTTISGQLIDLNTKHILGTKATYNRQAVFGSDVITRILYAQKEEGLESLHHALVDCMNAMIQELIQEHNIDLNDVTCCTGAGNTTMTHLLLRLDPAFLRREPYVPTANFVPVIRAAEVGIKINPRGLLACVPGVSSYVGGDITAGILACGMDRQDALTLLVDVGTNGEIVLGNKDWLISASASAGPAFEGSGVVSGMRAIRGAIQRVKIEPENLKVELGTIGKTIPQGICGSGYIDALSELLEAKVLDRQGKFNPEIKSPRIKEGEWGVEFTLADNIVLTEADIENLKRAKAAIFAAAASLLKHMNLDFEQLERIYIAGGFGTYLDVEKAIRIGLLPDVSRKKFTFIGNSSLVGSRFILLSNVAFKRVREIAQKITYFELSVEAGYFDEYTAALFFPHTDLSRFPSVKI